MLELKSRISPQTIASGMPKIVVSRFAMTTSARRTVPLRLKIKVSMPTIGTSAASARIGCGKKIGTAEFASIGLIANALPNVQRERREPAWYWLDSLQKPCAEHTVCVAGIQEQSAMEQRPGR